MNRNTHKQTSRDFKGFKESLERGECWICKKPNLSFDRSEPCMHWLLRPEGFKKKHFHLIYKSFSLYRLQSYLRWIANATEPFRNINDIPEEHGDNSVLAVTIIHSNLEWAFSASDNCIAGTGRRRYPHYHFQMRIDGLPFINFRENHIPLTPEDIWVLDVQQNKVAGIRQAGIHGMGLGGLAEHVDPEELLNGMRTTTDESTATYHVSTMVTAKNGNLISGDDIYNLFQESKATGIPVAKLVQKLDNVETRVVIEPGEGVAQAAPRKPVRKKKP